MAQRLSRGYQQRRSGVGHAATPPKNCNFSRLSSFTPSRTNYSFLRPSKTGRAGTPASGPSAVTVRSAGGKEAPCSDGVWGILAGLAGGPPPARPIPRRLTASSEETSRAFSVTSGNASKRPAKRNIPSGNISTSASKDKTAYASAAERLLVAIGEPELLDTSVDSRLSRIFSNKVIRRYPAFADFHGMEECIDQIVAFFRHAARAWRRRSRSFTCSARSAAVNPPWRKNSSN